MVCAASGPQDRRHARIHQSPARQPSGSLGNRLTVALDAQTDRQVAPPAHVLKARADEALAQARRELVADDRRQIKAIDEAVSRRGWDWSFRRSHDALHPGGPDRCVCRAHRLWHQEIEIGAV